MKKNVGSADRIIRIILAAIAIILYFAGAVTGILGIIILILGIMLLLTALFSFCGLYALLGINSCPKDNTAGTVK